MGQRGVPLVVPENWMALRLLLEGLAKRRNLAGVAVRNLLLQAIALSDQPLLFLNQA